MLLCRHASSRTITPFILMNILGLIFALLFIEILQLMLILGTIPSSIHRSLPPEYVSCALYTITEVLGILTTCFKGKLMVNFFLLINILASIFWTGVFLGNWSFIHHHNYGASDIFCYNHFICSIIQVISTFTGVIISSIKAKSSNFT